MYTHLTNNTILHNDGCKYKICHMLREDNEFSKCVEEDDRFFIKESRFSSTRPIYGNTQLIVYNSLNTTGVEGIIHRGSNIIVEVPHGYMIVFTSETFHARVKSYDQKNGGYLPHFRHLFILSNKTISQLEMKFNKC